MKKQKDPNNYDSSAIMASKEQAIKAIKNGDKVKKTFDWDKAAQILKDKKAKKAKAGLKEDQCWTCDTILKDGRPLTDAGTYLASIWATPVLIIQNGGTIPDEEIPCWTMDPDTQWNEYTVWPYSALRIFQDEREQ